MGKLKLLAIAVPFCMPCISFAYLFNSDSYTGNPVRLNVSAENPKAYFRISGSAPAFKNKEKFLEGKYANTDDSNFFKAVVIEAMQKWNDVDDSYVELVLAEAAGPGPNPEDDINNIAIGSGSWSDAGSALPVRGKTEANARYIVDCDITLDEDTNPETFSRTVLHELGHCLGLQHNHYSTKSVMSYADLNKKFALSLDDRAGVTVLYPVSYEKRKNLVPLCGSMASVAGARSAAQPFWLYLMMISPLALLLLPLLARRKKQSS
ncbi:MAG: matrixin family metalloprotease [Silvanigrellaceae bacterium]